MLFAFWYSMTLTIIIVGYPFTPRRWRRRFLAGATAAGLIFAVVKTEGPQITLWASHRFEDRRDLD